jgi:hypothetical protein
MNMREHEVSPQSYMSVGQLRLDTDEDEEAVVSSTV